MSVATVEKPPLEAFVEKLDERKMHLANEHHVASPDELLGLKREDLIDGLDEPAGATMALAETQGATTLFI